MSAGQDEDDEEVPPPPPDEPMPSELDLHAEMEAITLMDQRIQVLPTTQKRDLTPFWDSTKAVLLSHVAMQWLEGRDAR